MKTLKTTNVNVIFFISHLGFLGLGRLGKIVIYCFSGVLCVGIVVPDNKLMGKAVPLATIFQKKLREKSKILNKKLAKIQKV